MRAGWAAAIPAQPPFDLLRPFPAEQMIAWKVDKAVGNVRNDTAQLLETPPEEPTVGFCCGSATAMMLDLRPSQIVLELRQAPFYQRLCLHSPGSGVSDPQQHRWPRAHESSSCMNR